MIMRLALRVQTLILDLAETATVMKSASPLHLAECGKLSPETLVIFNRVLKDSDQETIATTFRSAFVEPCCLSRKEQVFERRALALLEVSLKDQASQAGPGFLALPLFGRVPPWFSRSPLYSAATMPHWNRPLSNVLETLSTIPEVTYEVPDDA